MVLLDAGKKTSVYKVGPVVAVYFHNSGVVTTRIHKGVFVSAYSVVSISPQTLFTFI
jgi:hypothetical protein